MFAESVEKEMKYGYFDDENKEYVITEPKTPLPWINYLGSGDFFRLISNTGGGYAFYKDASLMRITRYRYNNDRLDSNGHYIYIKDGDTVWNPGWQPVRTELDSYSARHGMGYTVITGTKNGVTAEQQVFVPLGQNCEVTRLILRNDSDKTKELDVFSYVEYCLWDAQDDMSNFQRNFSIGEVEVEGSTIYHKSEYRERRNHFTAFSVNRELDGFDTSRMEFAGVYNGAGHPDAVFEGKSRNSIAHGWAPVGSHHLKVTLEPGASESLIFVLAYCENPRDEKFIAPGVINKTPAEQVLSCFRTDEQVDDALAELKKYWNDLLSVYTAETEDEKLNREVNIWNQYQCMVTFNMSRSASYFESGLGRGMGFRDSCQDILGFVHLVPEKARERIIDLANTQFEDGSAYHQYQPLTKRGNSGIGSGFNDDPLWLIAAASAYIRETGDVSILDEPCDYDNDENNRAPLIDHLRKSFSYTRTHLGPHGLPLIGRADWNDCLNLNCFSEEPGEGFQTTGPSEGPVAESVFIGGMFVKYGREFEEILNLIGLTDEAEEAEKHVAGVEQAILDAGWDGEWFRRAYDAASLPVGSKVNEEGRIFIEPQGMCVMAGVGVDNGYAEKALKSVAEHLDSEYGVKLLDPPYTSYHKELGEITSYPPGYKENGGVFCHNNPWIIIAETILGHGDRATELLKKICPVHLEDKSEMHKTEPYAYCQMVSGPDAPVNGEGKNSWLTGSASWGFTSVSQYILGIRPGFTGLVIDPCIPSGWKGFKCTRKYRGATYEITVSNPDGKEKGIKEIRQDGAVLSGNTLPVAPEGSTVKVEVIM